MQTPHLLTLLTVAVIIGLTFGWASGDVARQSSRKFLPWFIAGSLFGPFALFWLLYFGNKHRCQTCKRRVRPLIGLCPHCLIEIETTSKRVPVR